MITVKVIRVIALMAVIYYLITGKQLEITPEMIDDCIARAKAIQNDTT